MSTTPRPIVKGTRVTVDRKWSWVDGFAATGRVTSVKGGGVAGVRLDNGNLRDFPVADLAPEIDYSLDRIEGARAALAKLDDEATR